MSFKRYYNEESVKGATPVFGEDFSPEINSSVDKVSTPLSINDVNGEYIGGLKVTTSQEVHIYADTNLLKSSYSAPINYESNGSYPILKINPELDLRNNGITQGAYSLNYNFLHKFVSDCKILQINGDRTEIRIEKVSNRETAFSNLFQKSSDFICCLKSFIDKK